MARAKKSEEPAKEPALLQISTEDFVRTRDSVVTGLATLQSAVQDLSRAYLAHTNTILGKGPGASLELLNVSNSLAIEHGLIPSGRLATPAPPPAPEQAEVKKRKRAPHDKNAPKRPVTPYFLYMSFAREGIARDMGPAAPAKQVADEGTRRWNSMDQEEKQKWQELYGANYLAYRKKVEAYKAGLPIPEFTKDQAQQLYRDAHKTGSVASPIRDASTDHEERLDEEEEEEEESDATSSDEDSPEPPKIASPPKSPRASKRAKGVKGKPEKKATPPPVKEPSPVERRPKTPEGDKKKKATKKRDARAMDEPMTEPKKVMETDVSSAAKSKQTRKKRKSEGADV